MKCLKKYTWVKVPRGEIPFHAKGILIYYMRLASRAAFRKGTARYCGHTNAVEVGSWVGGVVGLKSILDKETQGCAGNYGRASDAWLYHLHAGTGYQDPDL